MNLDVVPADLAAAGGRLAALAARVDDVRERLAREIGGCAPLLGAGVEEGVTSTGRAADRAMRALGDDVAQVSRALRTLSVVYRGVDDGAVGR